jgi:pyruvate/2-oxoglutarate/acetoin dehydrogenase E1 component
MGGRRGYGPTHSQTLEKIYLGIPGLRVLAPSNIGDPGQLLLQAILEDDEPVLFIENKTLYPLQIIEANTGEEIAFTALESNSRYPLYRMTVRDAPQTDITIAAYGYMVELARQAILQLAYEREILCEVIVLSQLAHFDTVALQEAVRQSGKILVIEEGTLPS